MLLTEFIVPVKLLDAMVARDVDELEALAVELAVRAVELAVGGEVEEAHEVAPGPGLLAGSEGGVVGGEADGRVGAGAEVDVGVVVEADVLPGVGVLEEVEVSVGLPFDWEA